VTLRHEVYVHGSRATSRASPDDRQLNFSCVIDEVTEERGEHSEGAQPILLGKY
jgi:hypothetical protein